MATYSNAEEVKQHYVERMGEELGSVFDALWNEVAWLYKEWSEFVELFGTKPSRIELLNETASLFFKIVQASLWEGTLLHIARLTDPPISAGKQNLTIKRLPNLIQVPEVAAKVTKLIEVAVEKAKFCRDWRNRYIAHCDLQLAIDEGAKPLTPVSKMQVKDALEAIAAVLNAIAEYYIRSTTAFGAMPGLYGAESLLYVIDDGLKAEKARQERIRAGQLRPDDYDSRDL